MTLFLMLTLSCFSSILCIRNNTRQSIYVYKRIKHNSVEIYERLINLENWINCFLSYPNVTVVADLNKYLEKYNQFFNVVVVKIKIKDRMYCRSVQRLLAQHGPIFLRYDYTFDFLMRYWGWNRQQVVNLRTWLTDSWYTWSLLKRFVHKYNYPIKQAYSLTVSQNSLNVTTTTSSLCVAGDHDNVTQSGLEHVARDSNHSPITIPAIGPRLWLRKSGPTSMPSLKKQPGKCNKKQ